MTWDEALNAAGVTVNSVLRQPGHIYYHLDIREIPGAQIAHTLAQTALPPPEALKGSSETGELGIKAKGLRGPRIKVKELSPHRTSKTLLRPKKLRLMQRKQRPRLKKLTQRPRTLLTPAKPERSSSSFEGQGLTTRLFMQFLL